MGIDVDFPRAFLKAEDGASTVLPATGVVFVSVRPEDKEAVKTIAALLAGAGFELDRVLAPGNDDPSRWAAVVRPCRGVDLDRALAPLLPAGGAAGTLISLPLLDAET
jgi:hypothetical protein